MRWMKRENLPAHHGCPVGVIARTLTRAILRAGMADRAVIFKGSKTEFSTKFEQYDYATPEEYVTEALAFKRAHPDRIVILHYTDARATSHEYAKEMLTHLEDERITVIHGIDLFRPEQERVGIAQGACHLPEAVARSGKASFIARGSVLTSEEIRMSEQYIERALRLQADGAPFSLVEITYPCYYRLMGRPTEQVTHEERQKLRVWFHDYVEAEFPNGIIKE